MVTVLIENTYECGRQSSSHEQVPAPTDDDLDEWFDEIVQPLTGDGHPCGSTDYALYEATVIEAPSNPELVGEKREWAG